MGDLSELIASIAEKGVIEPLIVRQRGSRLQIIAGERRYHAAVQAGLRELPVIERIASDAEVLELALIENLQRKDLTAFEEAEALQQLAQRCHYTHEDMARKLGKSRTSITEALALNNMPDEVRNLCRLADITSRRRCCRSSGRRHRKRCWRSSSEWRRRAPSHVRMCGAKPPRARRGAPAAVRVCLSRARPKRSDLRMSFTKSKVDKSEIIEALENIIRELKSSR